MKNKKAILGILLLLLSLTDITAQEEFKIQDPENHFSKKEKQIFERAVNYEMTFFNRIFPDKKSDFLDVKFTVIPNQIAYTVYIMNLADNVYNNTPGIYFPRIREFVVCTDKKFKKSFIRTSCHELSHAFLHLHSGNKPITAWLNEGLAAYLESMTYDKEKITQRTNHNYIARVKTLIELKDLDISDFVTWSYRKFLDESFTQEGYGYAIGYCMVFFLMQRDEDNAITIFRNLISEQPSKTIFDNCYTGGFTQFEKDFTEYWRNK